VKKCVFTVITGSYDWLKDPEYLTPRWDYICFTNNPLLVSNKWDIRMIDNPEGVDDARLARRVWQMYHHYVPEYDFSISIGADMQPVGDMDELLVTNLPMDDRIDFSIAQHPARRCLYAEAEKCISKKLDDVELIQRQMNHYRKDGYPKENGLVACGLIMRKKGRRNVEEHFERVWAEVKRWSKRDQLSFNYVLWKYHLVNVHLFNYDLARTKGGYFRKYPHGEKGQ